MKGYVQVYRNLNKKLGNEGNCVYSVRGSDGLVKKHTCHITLHDVTFRVGEKGKQRVRDEKRKNVHAYIQGRECYNEEEKRWEYIGPDCNYINDPDTITVYYNPYKCDSFIRTDTGEKITKAKVVVIGCGEKGKEVRALLWGNLACNLPHAAYQLTIKKFRKSLDKVTFLWYIILMNNDMRSFEVWILISIVLFIATLGFGFYIESI